jgi:SAM-dependent methyltransferase
VLDVGCGNARLARFLDEARGPIDYVGIDANAALLAAAHRRLPADLRDRCRLVQADFLAPGPPGEALPAGPFEAVVLMGVLHHVPGRDWRRALLEAAGARLAPGGLLALAVWQFADRPRFAGRRVAWSGIGPVCGAPLDPHALEPGDHLLRFGASPTAPPRYCHQVDDDEIAAWPEALGLDVVDDYLEDGASHDLNRYLLLRRPRAAGASAGGDPLEA